MRSRMNSIIEELDKIGQRESIHMTVKEIGSKGFCDRLKVEIIIEFKKPTNTLNGSRRFSIDVLQKVRSLFANSLSRGN